MITACAASPGHDRPLPSSSSSSRTIQPTRLTASATRILAVLGVVLLQGACLESCPYRRLERRGSTAWVSV